MAIPDLASFEDFIADASVVTEQPMTGPSELFYQSVATMHRPGSELWISYPPGPLQLNSVLQKVEEGLVEVGSPSNRSVALAVLAIILGTKGTTRHIEHANRIFTEVRRAELSFNFVSPTPPPHIDIRNDYDTIKVESFDPVRLEYWAKRGGARWPIDPKEMRGQVAFVSLLRDITVINTDRLPGFERLLRRGLGTAQSLVDSYFQSVSNALLDKLKIDTARRLSLVEAAGFAAVDFPTLVNWSYGIHLFTWTASRKTKAGCWAIFHMPGLNLNTPPPKTWQDARQWLVNEFGVDNLSGRDRTIDLAAQTFAGLMQDARVHYGDGNVREAFLYFVIALDHLLGEDGKNNSTVADRTSVLTHRIRSRTFAEEAAGVRRIYEVRSRLVHSGSPVSEEDLREADGLACGVLWAITRVVAGDEFQSRNAWVEKIDSLAHLLRGDPDLVTDIRLAAVGAFTNFRAGTPPPVVRDRGPARDS
jgi:hypothetical protein